MTRVNLDGLVKRYDRVAALDGATLELRAGELTYLLGPSGAGKTTLARVVAGLEPLDAGEVFIGGRPAHALPAADRKVGLVFQGDALWPRLTAAENVAYPLSLQKLTRAERRERAAEALSALHIDTLANQRPAALSPPQRLRVALARAIAARPSLLILDDPLGRLDPRAREEVREEVRRLHAETGLTTLVLTADPREALATAERLAVLDLGRVVQAGPPSDLYNGPADAFVARLLGPTNLVQAQVEGPGARGELIVRTPLGRLVGRTAGDDAHAPPPPAGTPVTVAIRPEALAIGPAVPAGSNRFPATVERLVFLGETRQIHLRGPGDWPVLALALQSQSRGLREGQGLTLSVPPEYVNVLPGKYAVPR